MLHLEYQIDDKVFFFFGKSYGLMDLSCMQEEFEKMGISHQKRPKQEPSPLL